MILAGNVAMESMGFKTFGFGGGRADVWEPEQDIYWGTEDTWLATSATAASAKLAKPAGRRPDGPDLREPEGPGGNPDPLASARDIRETFARMAMNDEETVALTPAATPSARPTAPATPARSARNPRARTSLEQGLGWRRTASAAAWAATPSPAASKAPGPPTRPWDNGYFDTLFGYEWELTKSPPARTSGRRRTAPVPTPCPTPTTRQAPRRR
jgi:catalase-peroxidase